MLVVVLVGMLAAATGPMALAQSGARVQGRPGPANVPPRAPSPAVSLQDILIGPVGSQAVYDVTYYALGAVEEATGLFVLLAESYESEYVAHAVRVRYTVVEPDAATGAPRLLVQAYEIDEESGSPVGEAGWEATYALAGGRAHWETGDRVPEQFEKLVAPGWLINWPLTEETHRPAGPLQPGAAWQSPADIPVSVLAEHQEPIPLNGRFVEWLQLDGIGAVAYIEEVATGGGAYTEELAPGLPAQFEFAVEASQDYYIHPGGFPVALVQFLRATLNAYLTPEVAAATGLDGTAALEFAFYQTAEQVWDDEFVWPFVAGASASGPELDRAGLYPELRPGVPVTGVLGRASEVLSDGTYLDVYTFRGQAEERIVLRLESDEFDPYLFLADDEAYVLAHDDDSAGDLNALLRTTLPYTGVYEVWVNTWSDGEMGTYTLSLETMAPFDVDDALALLAGLRTPQELSPADWERIEGALADLVDFVWEMRSEQ